jgi:hypothetical protein
VVFVGDGLDWGFSLEPAAISLECLSLEAATTGVAGAGIDGVRGVELTVRALDVRVAFVVFWVGVAAPTAAWMAVSICCSVTLHCQGRPSLYDYCWCAIYTVCLRDPISGRLAHVVFNEFGAGLRCRALNERLHLFADGAVGE